LRQVKQISPSDINSLLVNTFGGFLLSNRNPQWYGTFKTDMDELLARMLMAGIVAHENDDIYLTQLGKACGESSLKFDSVLRVIEIIKAIDFNNFQPIFLLALVQIINEMDGVYIPIVKKGHSERKYIDYFQERFSNNELLQTLQYGVRDPNIFLKRCKRAAVLFDWINGVSIGTIEENYSVNPYNSVNYGDIINVADTTRFHLQSVSLILSVLFPAETSFLTELDHILQRIEFGVPYDHLELVRSIPIRLTRGEYLDLFAAIGSDIEKIVSMDDSLLQRYISTVAVGPFKSLIRKVISNMPKQQRINDQ
jgi:replicative superfamily II helicase